MYGIADDFLGHVIILPGNGLDVTLIRTNFDLFPDMHPDDSPYKSPGFGGAQHCSILCIAGCDPITVFGLIEETIRRPIGGDLQSNSIAFYLRLEDNLWLFDAIEQSTWTFRHVTSRV